MRVLLADKLVDLAPARLRSRGFEVITAPELKGDTLRQALEQHNPTVLVVRSTRVEADHLVAAPGLALVVRAGAGVNTIDLEAASRGGVFVANCPGQNSVAVAELTFGLMLALDRHLADNVIDSRAGRWNKGEYSKARGLAGRTLGIVGVGQIGLEVIRRAKGFQMPVVAWSRSLTEARASELGVRRAASPVEVARQADVLSIHLALTPETRGLIDAEVLGALKPGSLILNTSRAEVLDEEALLHALDAGDLRAGLDVFSNEPSGKSGTFDHALARHPRVYATHHIGASSDQAQEAVATAVCEIIEAFHAEGIVRHCVNLAERTAADHVLVVRHRDRVGVLASVLQALREAELNIEEMENTIFAGAEAACARIQVAGTPSEELVARIHQAEHVFNVSVLTL